MALDIFFFVLSVWVCSSIMTAGAIKVERERIRQELLQLQQRSRKKKVDELYGRDQDS